MDKVEITCAACGVAWSTHGTPGHGFVIRPDQQFIKGNAATHYRIKSRRVVTLVKPAAGADFTLTVPATAVWRIDHFQAQLVTSAAVANRVPHFIVTDKDANRIYNVPSPGNQVAASTFQYSGATDSVSANFDNAVVVMLPQPLKLLQGWSLASLTTALDVADQWSNLAFMVKEYLAF